jgi:SAM-dependent methyltransferase
MPFDLRDQTIADFGDQWTVYTDNSGYYGSTALLQDVFGPLLAVEALRGSVVADVGAGTGRYTNILIGCAAKKVVAIEPSRAFEVLVTNTAAGRDRIEYLNIGGEAFVASEPLDFALSFGVVHHIPDPGPVVAAMFRALKPGGTIGLWLYGREGNGPYIMLLSVLATLTRRLPHALLAALTWFLYCPALAYALACRKLPLPLAGYMREVFLKLSPAKRRLVIYDQLNPSYAKYYREREVRALLETAGFSDIRLFHRHGYSWTAVATRPSTLHP